MPPVADQASPASTPSSGRRILQRITSPFASKPRNVSEFFIQVDDPHKQYSPGDVVTGSVKLRVVRPVRVTHVTVCLHGFVQVFKNPNAPGDAHRENYLGVGKGAKTGEYFGHGFATLFEDEVVLCGDGRLAEGPYQFNFELLFPDKDMPSSLDFERGTISYMVTATLTRPTAINPTITCDRKVYYLERIDIASLLPPKPRTVTLSPVSKRSRAKTTARKLVDSAERKSKKSDSATVSEQQTSSRGSTSQHGESESPQSPAPSEHSQETSNDSSVDHYTQISSSTETGSTINSKASGPDKSIVATMEICQGGCLRGDYVPVKIHINHTKQVRSMYGVIITLFRHARVDMHPDIPLGPTEKGDNKKFEDPFPKSFTGFGGLSLSGAGSSHTYRKDLAQTFKPLLVDPGTLSTTINAAIRVPDEAFPTISTVPGGMIAFKYYVEVVVDIQGKLAGYDKGIGSIGGLTTPAVKLDDGFEGERSAYTPFGSNVMDTAPLKRVQGVINCTFEFMVGTRNSERRRGKQKMEALPSHEPNQNQVAVEEHQQQHQHAQQAQPHQQQPFQVDNRAEQPRTNGQYQEPAYDENYDPYWDAYGSWQWVPHSPTTAYDHYYDWSYQPYDQPPPGVPVPQLPDESQMSEKERVRQHELRLLPSQPPGAYQQNGHASAAGPLPPSIPEEAALNHYTTSAPTAPAAEDLVPLVPTASLTPTATHASAITASTSLTPTSTQQFTSTAAPAYEPPQAGSSAAAAAAQATDDKQELQRQRLEAEASAPPTNGGNGEAAAASAPSAPPPPPHPAHEVATAPVFTSEHRSDVPPTVPNHTHDSHADAMGSNELPVYER